MRLRFCPSTTRSSGLEPACHSRKTVAVTVHRTGYKWVIGAEILISISAAEPHRTKEHMTEPKGTYALDNIRDLTGALAAWTSQLLHAGRIHSHPARHCDCGADSPIDPRP